MSGIGSQHRQSHSAHSESQDTLFKREVREPEGWTQVFSPVPQDHPLSCPFPVTFNRIRRQLPLALTPRNRHRGLWWPESLNVFSQDPLTISLNRKVKRFSFSTRTSFVPLSDTWGLIKEDVGLLSLPRKKLEKDTNWLPSSFPPTRALTPLPPKRPLSRSRNKYLFGASTQPLLCLLRVGRGQCLGPQSGPQ